MKLLRLVLSVNWKMRTRFTFLLYVMLYAYRKESMKELKVIISDIDESVQRILSNDFNLLTNVILELDILTRRNLLKCNDEIISKIENCTRRLCYALHCGRLHMTNSGMSKNQFSRFYLVFPVSVTITKYRCTNLVVDDTNQRRRWQNEVGGISYYRHICHHNDLEINNNY